jgi:hypothetical protein
MKGIVQSYGIEAIKRRGDRIERLFLHQEKPVESENIVSLFDFTFWDMEIWNLAA